MERRIRVLVATPGLDGHNRGAKVMARALRDAGMKVISTRLRQSPETIVNAALQDTCERSDYRSYPAPITLSCRRIFPVGAAVELKRLGVAGVVQPGAPLDSTVQFI